MKRLDLPPPPPAENLAADEALLDWCEAGHGDETLLFWEPRETFVVVGYANKVATEVNVAACEAKGRPDFPPLLRRRHRRPDARRIELLADSAHHRNRPDAKHHLRQPVHHGEKPRGD